MLFLVIALPAINIFNVLQLHTVLDEIIFGGQVLETSSAEVMKAVEEISRLSLSLSLCFCLFLFVYVGVNGIFCVSVSVCIGVTLELCINAVTFLMQVGNILKYYHTCP